MGRILQLFKSFRFLKRNHAVFPIYPDGIDRFFSLSIASGIVASWNIGSDRICYIANGHGLQPYTAGARQDGIEDTFPAKEYILGTGNRLDVHLDTGAETGYVTGIDYNFLTGLQLVLNKCSVDLRKSCPLSGQALHDEALTAEEARTQLLAEVDGKLHACFRCQESTLLENHFLSWANLDCLNLPGEAGTESDHAGAAPGCVGVLEHALSGKRPAEHPA